jgi:hypothetical protein
MGAVVDVAETARAPDVMTATPATASEAPRYRRAREKLNVPPRQARRSWRASLQASARAGNC